MRFSGYIELEEMCFFAYHGVLEQEKKVGNTFCINLRIHTDFSKACESDELEDTISYADIYRLVKTEMNLPSRLLEHVAGRIGNSVLKNYPSIDKIEIRISKINPPVGGEVRRASVMVEYENSSGISGKT